MLKVGCWYDVEGHHEPMKYLGKQGGDTHRFRTEWFGSYFVKEEDVHRVKATTNTEPRFQPAR